MQLRRLVYASPLVLALAGLAISHEFNSSNSGGLNCPSDIDGDFVVCPSGGFYERGTDGRWRLADQPVSAPTTTTTSTHDADPPLLVEVTTGPKGDKGDTGAIGPKGDKGDTGAIGPKGDKGDTGAIGATGKTGNTGPKGDKGDKGDTGRRGESATADWSAMSTATSTIVHADAPLSLGIGIGHMGGTTALAVGAQMKLKGGGRMALSLSTTGDEHSAAIGVAFPINW